MPQTASTLDDRAHLIPPTQILHRVAPVSHSIADGLARPRLCLALEPLVF